MCVSVRRERESERETAPQNASWQSSLFQIVLGLGWELWDSRLFGGLGVGVVG